MTVEDKNFYIKNGLSVGSGKHQILDSDGRITANYYTLNTGGRYLSAGVDIWDLINNVGIPPLSTNAWNETRNQFLEDKPRWDSVYSFVSSDSATNNTEYNRNTFVNVSGDTMLGYLQVGGPTYLENSLRVDGNTYLSAAMYVENDAHVMGDFRADGDVWLAVEGIYPKSIYLGATNDDRVVFYADVDSNIIPDKTKTYDFGSDGQQWSVLYTQDLSASRDANITRTVYANTIINNTSEYLSIYGGTGETDGAFFRLFHEDTTNPGNKNRFTIHADKFLVGDVLDDSGYSPWMMSISPDDNTVVFGSTIPDTNTFMTIHGSTAIKDTLRVEQDTTLQANLRVSGAGDIVGNFSVSGDTVLSGTMDVKGFTTLHDDLSVKGDLYVDGNAYLSAGEDGNIYVGDTNTDNVVFHADVDSNIIPDDDVTFDLGTNTQQWKELFVQDISATGDIFIDQNLAVSGAGDIVGNFSVSGDMVLSGTMDVKGFTTLHDDLSVKGDLFVDGNAYLSAGTDGNIYVGDTNTDNVVFRADVDSGIIPNIDVKYDLGTNTQQWRELFIQDISATNSIFVDNDLLVSANGTIGQDFRVSGATVVSGYTELSGTLDVKDSTTLHSSLSTLGDTTTVGDTVLSGMLTVAQDISALSDLYVDGNVWFKGDGSGTINLGDSDTDSVVFVADVSSNIIPDTNVTYNLGTSTKQWQEIFVQDISASRDIVVDNNITIGNDISARGDLYVDGNVWFKGDGSGVINLGDSDTDNVVFVADVDSDIIPNTNMSFDLGTADKHWMTTYTHDVSAHGDVNVENNIFAGGDTTVTGVLSVSGHTHMLSSLVVEQDVRIHGSLIVDDHAYFGFGDGAMNIGMSSDDKIVFNAEIDSHMIPDPSQTYDLGAIDQIWRYLYVHKVNTHDLSVTGDTHFSGPVTAHDGLTVVGDISATGDIYLRANTLRFSDKNFFNSVDASRGRALWTYVYGDSATNNSEYNSTTYLKTSGGEIDDLRVINDLTVDGDLEVNGNIYMDHDMMLTRSVEYLKPGEAQYVDLQSNNPNDPLQNSQYVVANWNNITNTHALVLPYNTTVKRVCLRASNSQSVDVRVGVHTNDKIVINSTEKEYQLFDRDPIEIRSNTFTDNYQTGLYTYTPGASAQAGSTLGLSISASRELRDLNVTIILSQRETKPGPPGLYDSVLIDHVEEW